MPQINASIVATLRTVVDSYVCPRDWQTTLLCEESQLPPNTEHDLEIVVFTRDRNDRYAWLLGLIGKGASVPTAALSCGLSRLKFNRWRRQGLADQDAGIDSYYSRFVEDLNFFMTLPGMDAEARVLAKSPLDWLQFGPGRWLHPEGTWQVKPSQTQEETMKPESCGIAESNAIVEDDTDYLIGAPTVADLPAALAVLEQSGMGHLIDEARATAQERLKDAVPTAPIEE